MRLQRVAKPFDNPEFLFELKHDGYRAVAYIEHGECRLISRNQKVLKFQSLSDALGRLRVEDAVLDGEIISLDSQGVSHFKRLFSQKQEAVFYAFDVLWLEGEDLRMLPLLERKQRLEKLIKKSHCRQLLFAHHVIGQGVGLFEQICERSLEGVIAKRVDGIYRDDGQD